VALLLLFLTFFSSDDIPLDFGEPAVAEVDVVTLRSRIMLLNRAPSASAGLVVAPAAVQHSCDVSAIVASVAASKPLPVAPVLVTPARSLASSRLACTTPSQLPRPSPGSASRRTNPRHAQYPSRIPQPSSSKRAAAVAAPAGLSSSLRRKPVVEETSTEMFERKLNAVLDMDAADVFAVSAKEQRSPEPRQHSGYTPIKKIPIAATDEAFAITKKVLTME
jgi:hypothetical protein